MAPEFILEEKVGVNQTLHTPSKKNKERKKEKKTFVEHLPCSSALYSRKYSSILSSGLLIWFSAKFTEFLNLYF